MSIRPTGIALFKRILLVHHVDSRLLSAYQHIRGRLFGLPGDLAGGSILCPLETYPIEQSRPVHPSICVSVL